MWVQELTDADLIERFGPETIRRGTEYASQGRVGTIRVAGNAVVLAQVRGQHWRSYQTSVVCDSAGLRGSCSCPMRTDCKHVAALLLQMRGVARRQATPAWQLALRPLLDTHVSGPRGVPMALEFSDRIDGISMRPLRLGTKGAWVKSGASWNDLTYGSTRTELDRIHLATLQALLKCERQDAYTYGYGHSSDSLLLNALRYDVWDLLRRARDTGIVFLAGSDTYRGRAKAPELLDIRVEPRLKVSVTSDGVAVGAELVVGERIVAVNEAVLLGRPAHGVALRDEDALRLAPLSRPLSDAEHRLFSQTQMLTVPASELSAFATGYLPKLRERLPVLLDDEVRLPEPERPRLVCRVKFSRGSGVVDWRFRYGSGTNAVNLTPLGVEGEPPVRDPVAERALTDSVPEGIWLSSDHFGTTQLQTVILNGRRLFAFVSDTLPALQHLDGVDVEMNEPPPEFHEATEAPVVSLSVTDSHDRDWFNLGVSVTLGGEQVPLTELLTALTRRDDHLLLDSGTWFSLDAPELDQLRQLVAEARRLGDSGSSGLRIRVEHAGLWNELVGYGVIARQSAAWQKAVTALLDLDSLPEPPAPTGLRAELRPYQQAGFSWLSFLRTTRLGGILADEMGLGKTVQALALTQATFESGELDAPVLVVAPTSVVATWAAEAARFTPDLTVVTVTGTQKRRGTPIADVVAGAQLVVTSYTLLRLEADQYAPLAWGAVFLDEAQFVKNHMSQAYRAVRRLSAPTKIALTGTPLENNLMDLWSILSITSPGLFPDPRDFAELYRKPIESGDHDALVRLHARIKPLLLRRTKAAVATELPEKQEQVIPVELSAPHRRLYDRHLTKERQRILRLVGDLNRNRFTILTALTMLRQLALAPRLVEASYPAQSAKIDTLVELLQELISEGHRALVFSQFTGFLALVKARLTSEKIDFEYLDGRTRDRAARIEAFRTGTAPVFCISLKAGGFGLTLTEADYVFILDPWWNPAAETQAIDRTHRIGQDKPVNVYRLVSKDTIEEKVVALQERKRHLFDSVVGSGTDLAAPLSAEDIRGLLGAD